MDIIFQFHNAPVSAPLRRRAEAAIEDASRRLRRAVDATVRFERDGPTRRVEIVLRAPRQRTLVAVGEARGFVAALASATSRLNAQLRRLKSLRTSKVRGPARA